MGSERMRARDVRILGMGAKKWFRLCKYRKVPLRVLMHRLKPGSWLLGTGSLRSKGDAQRGLLHGGPTARDPQVLPLVLPPCTAPPCPPTLLEPGRVAPATPGWWRSGEAARALDGRSRSPWSPWDYRHLAVTVGPGMSVGWAWGSGAQVQGKPALGTRAVLRAPAFCQTRTEVQLCLSSAVALEHVTFLP